MQITLTFDNPSDAIEFLQSLPEDATASVAASAEVPSEPPKKKTTRKKAPKKEEPKELTAEQHEQLKGIIAKLVEQPDGISKLQELLAQYNLTSARHIKPGDYPAFYAELEAIVASE